MKLERAENGKRNILYGIISKVVAIVLPFLIRTVVIRTLGAEYLGLNGLFASILQVLNMSELGFSSAVVYSMYRPIAENDEEAICALLNFYRKVYKVIGTCILTAGLMLLPFLTHLIKDGAVPAGMNIYILYVIYLANTVISYYLFAYKTSLLYAFQRVDVVSRTLTLTQGLMYLCQIGILLCLKDYYLYLVMMPVFTILNNLINNRKIKRLFPQYVCRGKIHEREYSAIKRQVPGLMINKLCQTSRNALDSIFISAFLGLSASGMYGNYYYVMNALISVLIIFDNSIIAGVGNSEVTESKEKNYRTMNQLNFIYMWIVGWCSICMFNLYQPFVQLFFGKEMLFSMDITALFCIYFYVLGMGVVRGIYKEAAGLWWETRYYSIAETTGNLLLNYYLGKYFGVAGIIAATLITLFFINFLMGTNVVFKYYFQNGKIAEYYLLHGKYALATLTAGTLSTILISRVPGEGIASLAAKGILCALVPNVIYLFLYFRTKEYRSSIGWLLGIFGLSRRLSFLLPRRQRR
ncbi:MAG: hypothetical protein K6E30_06405 [Lachnospiraceae bacterium]|nr:hypothetical protein [Lachnospiraceae bacterium]